MLPTMNVRGAARVLLVCTNNTVGTVYAHTRMRVRTAVKPSSTVGGTHPPTHATHDTKASKPQRIAQFTASKQREHLPSC